MTDKTTLLIVDDDEDVLTAARLLLRRHFGRVITQTDPGKIPELMAAEAIDVFLLDMNFAIGRNSGKEGLHWLGDIRQRDPNAVVVLMTAFGDLNTAVAAMREGATDFVLKPWQNDRLIATLRVAADLRHTRAQLSALTAPPPEETMIAGSASMQRVMKMVERVAGTDATVLIRGENGTGKELIAQELHRLSARSDAPMVSVDLGALAESLFESELFGHRRGAFTGADSDRAGRFQAASGGTLFLDEIGNLPLALQTKLLRALENREVTPLGADQEIDVDIRLIAATNQPLEDMVARGEFREDLLYRINTISIELPPLRERLEDLPELARFFAAQAARRYRLPAKEVPAKVLQRLAQWSWPGNIRELSHTMERAVIMGERDALAIEDFDLKSRQVDAAAETLNLEENERRLVQTALQRYEGNVSRAADALGITRAALYRRMEKFDL
ncbi:sigma-54-dependent transcriptional regulator [Congregibacter litoralis]|uniref:Response regulator n=1 Tax=Congregibacter litoralis KT71 TaxID=314285 RepID=A4ABN9_9GAMM|nr:sigma-54 dependent transcriptional regulator [Congregibacter litoralis]EAQ96552.1 Response regulator [Congregibacter litoralis KT71]